jgi:anti-anti-sigma factor
MAFVVVICRHGFFGLFFVRHEPGQELAVADRTKFITSYNSLQTCNFPLMTPRELRRLILRIMIRESEAAMFTVQVDKSGEVAVLQCTGRFVRGNAVREVREKVTSLKNARVIVLDLSDVEILDGGGLGALVFLHRWTEDNGIQLKLVNPSHFVREVLEATHLIDVLNVSSVCDAVRILGCPDLALARYAAAI